MTTSLLRRTSSNVIRHPAHDDACFGGQSPAQGTALRTAARRREVCFILKARMRHAQNRPQTADAVKPAAGVNPRMLHGMPVAFLGVAQRGCSLKNCVQHGTSVGGATSAIATRKARQWYSAPKIQAVQKPSSTAGRRLTSMAGIMFLAVALALVT